MLTQSTMQHLGINKSRHDAQASIEGGARYLENINGEAFVLQFT